MMRVSPIASGLVAAALAWAVFAPAGTGQPAETDVAALRASASAYTVAMNKADFAALADAWAPDAEYTHADGETLKGRDAIVAALRAALADAKGVSYSYTMSAPRILNGTVALQDGTATTTTPEGTTTGRFSAVWVKNPDRWRLAQVRELPDEALPGTDDDSPLRELDWLIGDWVADKHGVTVTVRPTLGGAFLRQDYVLGEGDDATTVFNLIGSDPLTGRIKSWTFDSRGGYGEALWSREGNSWFLDTVGVLPEGAAGTARNVLRFIDENTIVFESRDRAIEGRPIPDSSVQLTRKAQ